MAISPGFTPGISTQPVNKGGTGSTTAAGARSNLGVAAAVGTTTDNAIVRFDGVTGAQQNSGVTIDDSNNLVVTGTTATIQNATADPTLHIKATANTYNPIVRFEGFDRNIYIGVKDAGGDGTFNVSTASTLASPLFSLDPATNVAAFAGSIIIATGTPASAAAAGTAGTIAWDASYIYVCTATNTWKRVAIATW